MLIVRTTQMRAIEASLVRSFEDRTYAHLQKYFPQHCLLLGEKQMRKLIHQGWQKAKGYDLTAESCVCSYIEFMCRLGSGFDKDPLLPWAAAILNERSTMDQIARGDQLYQQAWEYIEHISKDYRDDVGQPTTARFVDEIRSLRQSKDEVPSQSAHPDFAKRMVLRLESNFPAKCQYVGEERLQTFILGAIESARAFGITSERGITIYAVLMFVLGNGFANDLLLPWVSKVLNDKEIANEIDRVDRLYAEGVGFLKRWWDSAPIRGDRS